MLVPAALALLLSTPSASAPEPPRGDRVAEWCEDLLSLVDAMTAQHPDLFYSVSREEFEDAVGALYDGVADMHDDEVLVECMRLFALVSRGGKDGHSGIAPGQAAPRLPLRLYRFSDGWFVVGAATEHAQLVGARVDAIAGTPIEQAAELVRGIVSADNDMNRTGKAAAYLTSVEVLHGLGVIDDTATVELALTINGSAKSVAFTPQAGMLHIGHGGGALPPDERALWLSRPGEMWWHAVVDDALYVQFNAVLATSSAGQSIQSFADEVVAAFDAGGCDRLVIDVRQNGGGNNQSFHPLIAALQAHERINTQGKLFVLAGRATFSAAGNFVTVIEREAHSILMGEDTGGGPNQYGDARNISLPHHHGFTARISTRYHEFDAEHPDRLTHEPHVRVELSSADWLAGRDPVLQRALEYGK